MEMVMEWSLSDKKARKVYDAPNHAYEVDVTFFPKIFVQGNKNARLDIQDILYNADITR